MRVALVKNGGNWCRLMGEEMESTQNRLFSMLDQGKFTSWGFGGSLKEKQKNRSYPAFRTNSFIQPLYFRCDL